MLLLSAVAAIMFASCGSGPETEAEREARIKSGNFTAFELENGIGPIREPMELPAQIDPALAAKGQEIFAAKCMTCHRLDTRLTAPPLRDVAVRRTSAYIMNQILNPEAMGKYHPEGKKLVAQYMLTMTIMGVTQDDARALLEYLRDESKKTPQPAS